MMLGVFRGKWEGCMDTATCRKARKGLVCARRHDGCDTASLVSEAHTRSVYPNLGLSPSCSYFTAFLDPCVPLNCIVNCNVGGQNNSQQEGLSFMQRN